MTENENAVSTNTDTKEDTTPAEIEQEITIPVKFNKEVKELALSEATALAQKGMKYDLIKEDYEELKALAQNSGKSIPQYISDLKNQKFNERKNELTEICGGDSQLAEHFARLENENVPDGGFSELKEMFPDITEESIPEEVKENAKLKGRLLLDEYLRYRQREANRKKNASAQQKRAEDLSLGSQQNRQSAESPETEEFLKGLWK